jgi:hypothetical protein
MPLFEIRHRWTASRLFSLEVPSLRLTLEAAVKADADLQDAHLRGADLRDADLRDADLRDADLRDADLTPTRDDLWAVLSGAPAEVPALRAALVAGQIDGSTYRGDCACLVGTLAKARGCDINGLADIAPDSSRLIERWFTNLRPGDTPETSVVAAHTLAWIDTFLHNMRQAFGREQAAAPVLHEEAVGPPRPR